MLFYNQQKVAKMYYHPSIFAVRQSVNETLPQILVTLNNIHTAVKVMILSQCLSLLLAIVPSICLQHLVLLQRNN